jgi:hypothetical protein
MGRLEAKMRRRRSCPLHLIATLRTATGTIPKQCAFAMTYGMASTARRNIVLIGTT